MRRLKYLKNQLPDSMGFGFAEFELDDPRGNPIPVMYGVAFRARPETVVDSAKPHAREVDAGRVAH
jgi:hypothetical protein